MGISIVEHAGSTSRPIGYRADQRGAQRFTLLLRQAKLITADSEFLCVIRDISRTGLRIKLFHKLPAPNRMAIALREDWPFMIEKMWEADGNAGFRFREPIDLEELLHDDARFPKRQLRTRLELPLSIHGNGRSDMAIIANLSQQGACIISATPWARDELVRLESPVLPQIHAKVRWRQGALHGLVFEETFSFRDFARLLGQLHGLE